MTSQAFTDYFVRHPKQFRYIRFRKLQNEKVHRHKRKSLSLLQSDYNQITISYNQRRHRLHLGSTQYKQFPQKKKKGERKKGKRWKRGEEEKGMERVCTEGKGKGENEMWKKR